MDSIGVLRVCVLVLLFVLAMGALLVILRDVCSNTSSIALLHMVLQAV